jgi:aminoglycoside phosphotransferase (APT) family kinase protein
MSGSRADLASSIADLLEAVLERRPRISDLEPMSGGASRETWSFSAIDSGSERRLILRCDPPGRPSEPGAMALEARLMRRAAEAGLRVPAVVADDPDGAVLGSAGLVMQRVEGETLARRIQRDQAYTAARSVLVAECAEFLAGLHALDPSSVEGLVLLDPLEHYRQRWRDLDDVSPTFELAFRWLDAHRPAPRSPAIVHGDFRLGNLIVDGDGLAAVLDWELAHAGDPLEDLAWLCTKAWRFRQPLAVAGIGDTGVLLAAYAAAGGAPVDADGFHWWLVFSALKWGVICCWQAAAHLTGAQRSVELAAIGRRAAEQEWDLIELLDPQACTSALADADSGHYDQPVVDDPGVYGRPTAGELLVAVREFVNGDVLAATGDDRRLQFHGRVAGNVLAIVERQLQLTAGQSVRHRRLFDDLGAGGVCELAQQIRAGEWDERGERLRPALAALARDKLAIAEPRHLALPIETGGLP